MTEHEFEPKILALVCTYCTYTAADMAGSMRLQYPPNVRVVKLLCTGRVDINHLGIDRSSQVPATVVVHAGERVQLDISIDTGIR